jgi:DNA-binding transcriptional MerR regulator
MPDSTVADHGYLTRGQVAHALGVVEATIRRWERCEGLPYMAVGHRRFYSLKRVLDWLDGREASRKRA